MRKVWYGVVGVALAAVVGLPAATAAKGESVKLSKEDRAALAGRSGDVQLLVAAKPGAANALASAVASLGGSVRYADTALDYVRVKVSADRADAVAKLPSVQAAELDRVDPLPDPRPDADAPAVDPPGSGTPAQNPYMPTRDIGAPQFVDAHPTYDGRGVTIGIVDSGVDVLTPELQEAKTLAGATVPKITDWVTMTEPADNDPTWIDMKDQVSGATFTYKDVSYTAPLAGTYRIGLFNERSPNLGGELGRDVNRDGNPQGSKGIFAVLWNAATGEVWVDTNQNNSFADQAAMRDFKLNRDIGIFGTDNPATTLRETVPFVVQADGKNKLVNIGIVSGAHGTHVTGIAAGKDFFNGAYDGAAPEAQVKVVRACLFIAGCPNHATTEGMIYLAKQAGVDVINMSIGGLPALNDGNNARGVIFNRLIRQTKVQLFFSAGNSGAGVNTVGDPSVATDVMSVAASVTKESYLANYGNDTPQAEQMFVFSSRGPREDGGFKPNITAPGSAVSTVPAWQTAAISGGCLAYSCPPGYAMFNGTSMAAPEATGGAALLISAAKQAGAQFAPDQLRQAINSSARWLPNAQAHEQGNGVMNVGAAWDLLRTNIKTVQISSSAPVDTVISDFLAQPDAGPGIYYREGFAVGETRTPKVTFVRTSGGSKPVTYNLTWKGNDGTFQAAATTIALPLNTPVTLEVAVHPAATGVHSAILSLDDPGTTGIDYQTLNTVVASDAITGPSYATTYNGTVKQADMKTFFFRVPAGTPALKIDVTPSVNTRIRLTRFHPYGVPIEAPGFTTVLAGETLSRTIQDPFPGVWEAVVDQTRGDTSGAIVLPDETPFSITGSLLGATVAPNPDVITSATVGSPVARSYTMTNVFGAFTGRAVGTALGSARRETPSISTGETQPYDITVPAGATSLRATIGGTSDPGADLDLFVQNCTSGTCVAAGQSADGDSEESVTVGNPAAGHWRVLVDGFAVPAGTTTYKYIDVFAHPSFGAITVTDANALRDAGTSWTAPASVAANASPGTGRVLYGNVRVLTDTDVQIGSGDVIVESVTP